MTFDIILRYIFPENFIESHLEDLKMSINFYYFRQFLGFFDICLLRKN